MDDISDHTEDIEDLENMESDEATAEDEVDESNENIIEEMDNEEAANEAEDKKELADSSSEQTGVAKEDIVEDRSEDNFNLDETTDVQIETETTDILETTTEVIAPSLETIIYHNEAEAIVEHSIHEEVNIDVDIQTESTESVEVQQYLSTQNSEKVSEVEEGDVQKFGIWTSEIADVTYTGSAIKPIIRVYDGTTLLMEGLDYTLTYKNNTKVNTSGSGKKAPQVVVKMKGKYKGSHTVYFKIQPMDISSNDCVSNDVVAKYTGKKLTPKPTLMWNGKKLKYGTDFSVDEYSNGSFKDEGTYTLTLTGKNNFTGQKKITFTISNNKNQIDMSKITVKGIVNKGYTGSQITQVPTTVKYKKDILKETTDYTITYGENKALGIGTITFTGTGTDTDNDGLSYIGSKTVTFKITGESLSKVKISGIDKQYTYTGSLIKPTATLTHNSTILKEGTDYTVAYQKNRNKGTATIIFTGLNGYTGTKKQTFKIVAGTMADTPEKPELPDTKPEKPDTTPDNNVKDDTTNTTPAYVGDAFQEQLLKEINEYRVADGEKKLRLHSSLTESAMITAKELSTDFSMLTPNVKIPYESIQGLALKVPTNSSVFEALKDDFFFEGTIVSPKFFDCGIGYYIVDDTIYVSLVFCALKDSE